MESKFMNLLVFGLIQALSYPQPIPVNQADTYHGITVSDPYRYLEDSDKQETKAWIEAEQALSDNFLQNLKSRTKWKGLLEKVWNFERVSAPQKVGGRYFFLKNTGLQNQPVLYYRESLRETDKTLLDLNLDSPKGLLSLQFFVPNRNGKLLAYGVSEAGSDWTEIFVRDVATCTNLSDRLKWVKFSSVAWSPSHDGFYYCRYKEPAIGLELQAIINNQIVYFHKLGTDQSEDTLIYEREDHPSWMFDPIVSEDGNYLILSVVSGCEAASALFYQKLHTKEPFQKLCAAFDAKYSYLGNVADTFFIQTDLKAPKGSIVTKKLGENQLNTIIAEKEETLLDSQIIADQFLLHYLKDATSRLEIVSLDGKSSSTIALPTLGSATGFSGKQKDLETFYTFSNFIQPQTVYRYNFTTKKSELFFQPRLAIQPEELELKQLFYTSLDGTRIPIFLAGKKETFAQQNQPLHLYGYGGFNVSLSPWFSPKFFAWICDGGILAVPNIRGGGEYGEAWHKGGSLEKKQNGFDDFITAATFLIEEKITTSSRLSIGGGSNGGLLVGACITQRPELFGAALPSVGVLDMLRFHKFTIGWAWIPEYGSSDIPEQFTYLYRYSPLHNIRKGIGYPPTLITTADHDDRVVPSHSFKFAATLQEAQGGTSPILIHIQKSAGHSAGTPTNKLIEQAADSLAFLEEFTKKKSAS